MKCNVKNNSNLDMKEFMPLLDSFLPYAHKNMGFNRPPSLFFTSDAENAEKPLGKTAFYEPDELKITIFVDKRHPKDIMRSLSHELVHHTQNCRGDFSEDLMGEMGEGYAQKNPHLREMEREAFEKGNLVFRDWEDKSKETLQESIYYNKGEKVEMKYKDWRNAETNALLMEKWGYKDTISEQDEDIEIDLPEPPAAPEIEPPEPQPIDEPPEVEMPKVEIPKVEMPEMPEIEEPVLAEEEEEVPADRINIPGLRLSAISENSSHGKNTVVLKEQLIRKIIREAFNRTKK